MGEGHLGLVEYVSMNQFFFIVWGLLKPISTGKYLGLYPKMLMKKISYSRMFQRSPSSRNSVLAKQQQRRPQKNLKQSLRVSPRTLRLPLKTSVSRSGPVRFFSLFWTRPGPDRSSEISFLGKNRTGLGKTGLHRSGLKYLSTLNRLRPRPV